MVVLGDVFFASRPRSLAKDRHRSGELACIPQAARRNLGSAVREARRRSPTVATRLDRDRHPSRPGIAVSDLGVPGSRPQQRCSSGPSPQRSVPRCAGSGACWGIASKDGRRGAVRVRTRPERLPRAALPPAPGPERASRPLRRARSGASDAYPGFKRACTHVTSCESTVLIPSCSSQEM